MNLRKKNKKAYYLWADNYSEYALNKIESRGYSYDYLAEEIIENADVKKDSRVLDVGTGTGLIAGKIFKLIDNPNC